MNLKRMKFLMQRKFSFLLSHSCFRLSTLFKKNRCVLILTALLYFVIVSVTRQITELYKTTKNFITDFEQKFCQSAFRPVKLLLHRDTYTRLFPFRFMWFWFLSSKSRGYVFSFSSALLALQTSCSKITLSSKLHR